MPDSNNQPLLPEDLRFTCNAAGQVRTETRAGREYLVAPVIAIKAGVLNGELVPASEIEPTLAAWNGRPFVLGHPTDGTRFVTANQPELIGRSAVGQFYNARWDAATQRMKGEIWVDVGLAQAAGQAGERTLARLRSGDPLEVSTAYLRELDATPGEFQGLPYTGIARKLQPDHLAGLLDDRGACSWSDGCGAPRVNAQLPAGYREADGDERCANCAAFQDNRCATHGLEVNAGGVCNDYQAPDTEDDAEELADNAETFQPPAGAKANAEKVLRWREEHGDAVKGMTEVGWRRARQLASGKPVGLDTVRAMSGFARHEKNATIAPEFRSEPWRDRGYVAWLGWGGTTGINWAKRISERVGNQHRASLMTKVLQVAKRLGIVKSEEDSMSKKIEQILACAPLALVANREALEALDEEALDGLLALAGAGSGCGCESVQANSEEADPESVGAPVEPVAAPSALEALETALQPIGGVAGLLEAVAGLKTNADAERAKLLKALSTYERCTLAANHLQALPTDALRQLEQAFRPVSYAGRGGFEQAAPAEELEDYVSPTANLFQPKEGK